MQSLFGVPIGQVLAVLAGIFGVGMLLLALMALRNPVVFFLGVRNVPRRRGQTALIVVGLMLATVIFSASFATGDTLTHSVRVLALDQLGQVDELVTTAAPDPSGRPGYFGADESDDVRAALADAPVDGVMAAIRETVPVVAATSGLSEPRTDVLGLDESQLAGFDRPTDAAGNVLSLAALAPGDLYVSTNLAERLEVGVGDALLAYLGSTPTPLRIAGIYDRGVYPAVKRSAVMPLATLQAMLGRDGQINAVFVSNRGDAVGGARQTDAVVGALEPALAGAGLDVAPIKQDALNEADALGTMFSSIFLLFGQFSVVAGILLIFLIFVMLAAERKHEMGIARAVGMQRGHLVRMFMFEGTTYALLAAAVGSALGVVVGWGMVRIMSIALGQIDLELRYLLNWKSVAIAFLLGMVFTFGVVVVSAWWVSRLNVVRAIRDVPEPRLRRRSIRALIVTLALPLLGGLLTWSGINSAQGATFMLGTSLLIIGVPMLARRIGLADRVAYTIAGVGLVVWWLLPEVTLNWLIPGLPDFSAGMEMFLLSGVLIVLGAVWAVMYNSDLLLAGLVAAFGRVPGLPPILRTAVSYPSQNRFRTGVTLAMFSLVVFTLVVMSFILDAAASVYDDTSRLAGGFDVRIEVSPANPIPDLRTALANAPGINPGEITVIGTGTYVPARARQAGSTIEPADTVLFGIDAAFAEAVGYDMSMRAAEYDSAAAVWRALVNEPGTAVVASFLVPARVNYSAGGPSPSFRLEGFYAEDETLPRVFIEVTDPRTGHVEQLRVIGALDALGVYGGEVMTSMTTLDQVLGQPPPPLWYLLGLAPGVDATAFAATLRRDFAANGMQAESTADEIRDGTQANLMLNNLLQGFMGLGLVVGVAALGVIAARAVVERRKEIGVMRAIGFQREMVQASFLIESSFVALLGTIIGTALAAILSVTIVNEIASTAEGVTYSVPWLNIGLIVVIAYGASLLTTFLPAYQATRVRPAEALRFE
ncbi:MAG: FtsX-like permease family protein [Chloroflexi bacterium]|nr:FtsX-like permease family protein [Chloroflexota bacterium]MDA1002849.1 FtsX-like permease family protein [Chloroflexota bacterium]